MLLQSTTSLAVGCKGLVLLKLVINHASHSVSEPYHSVDVSCQKLESHVQLSG